MADSPILLCKHSLIHEPKFLESKTTKFLTLTYFITIDEMKVLLSMLMTPAKSSDYRIHFAANVLRHFEA